MILKKPLTVAIILLFFSVSVIPSAGIITFNDDTTPPVTTFSLNPPTPDGYNGWFVSDVTITLEASDDMSGVNATYYRVNNGEWETYTEPFTMESDGHCLFEFYSVDNAGNVEDVKSFEIKIDQTLPDIAFYYWLFKEKGKWYITYTAICNDDTSGIDRAELYINKELVATDDEEPFEWTYEWSDIFRLLNIKALAFDQAGNSNYDDEYSLAPKRSVTGFIYNSEVTDQNITFFALLVLKAIYYEFGFGAPAVSYKLCMFTQLAIPSEHTGHIGKHFIRASYYDW